MIPSVGRIVHYVSYGTPNGEYASQCRAAIVTEVAQDLDTVSLCVLNPTGQFFNIAVRFHDGAETPGATDCPEAEFHGNPFKYHHCGWVEATYVGGTWHWPERV